MKFVIFTLLVVSAHAVEIRDTLRLPDGSYPAGRLVITLASGTHSGSTTFAGFRKTVQVTNGVVRTNLEPNATLTPAGTAYRVEYYLSDGVTQVEYWTVPLSATPLTIRQVRGSVAPSPSVVVALSQLGACGSGSGQVLTWNGSSWVCGAGAGNYSVTFTSLATWTVTGATHGIQSKNLVVQCYDNATPAVLVDCAVTVHPATYTVTAAFVGAQSGYIVIAGMGIGSTPNYAKSVTAATSSTITSAEHGILSNRMLVQCYDSSTPANQVECGVTIHPSTYLVTVTFAVAHTGYIVVSGR